MKQLLFFRLALGETRGLAFAQASRSARLTRSSVSLASLSLAFGFLLRASTRRFEAVEIGQHQFGFDDFDVGNRIDAAFDMGDVVVLEAAQHMGDGVDLADIGEKLIAEPLAFRRAAHQAGDVDEGQPRRHDDRRLGEFGQRVEPLVRHRDLADIRLDGAERIIRRLRGGGFVNALKRVDLPTFGRPTMPHLKPIGIFTCSVPSS